MRAYILSIGTELTHGRLTDTNATFLAQELLLQGIELLHVVQTGDDLPRLTDTIRLALSDADLVICSGGIGPTGDDLTREAIAAVVGEEPAVDPGLLATLEAFFAARGATMPARNAKQAWLIPAASPLLNPIGTAPGWFVEYESKAIVAMPGVPREMFRMWREQAMPRIAARLPARVVSATTFKTIGIGESAAEQELLDLVDRPNPVVATYAKDDGVQVRISAVGATQSEAEQLRDETVAEVERRLGKYIYGMEDESLASVLAMLLRRAGLTLGVLELGSGGRFAALLQSDPIVSGVPAGAMARPKSAGEPLSRQASELATEAVERFGTALGAGITVDVSESDPGVFRGTVSVALRGAREATEEFSTRAGFEDVQRRAALSAADVLRRALLS